MSEKPFNAEYLLELALKQITLHALVLLDDRGIIRGWLGGAENVLGYKAGEIIGHPVSKLFTQEDLDRGLDRLEIEMAAASGEGDDDRWQVRKDGAKIWATGAMAPLRDTTGRIVGYAKVLRNRTDNKTHVEALEAQINALEKAQELRMSSAATLAHEMRSPLSSLSMATALLQTQPDAENMAIAVGILKNQCDLMSRLIDNMIEATRANAGKLEIHKECVVLQEIIEKAVKACQPAVDRHRHRLQLLMPIDPVPLMVDPTRMHQVFVNLIDNAIKYTPHGGNIWIKATIDGEDAVIKVQDTGIGLSPELVPHIFDLFIQAHSERSAGGGLGIGLSLVKSFVAMHEGTVQALSDGEGKGSVFVVRLPAAEERSGSATPEDR